MLGPGLSWRGAGEDTGTLRLALMQGSASPSCLSPPSHLGTSLRKWGMAEHLWGLLSFLPVLGSRL